MVRDRVIAYQFSFAVYSLHLDPVEVTTYLLEGMSSRLIQIGS